MTTFHHGIPIDFAAIRRGLTDLPRASNHVPGAPVDAQEVYTPQGHRNALDPDRVLVVGNRGMGKSFWAHALVQDDIRERAARDYQQPGLRTAETVFGFNGSDLHQKVAPSQAVIAQAVDRDGKDPESVWRAVLLRAVAGGGEVVLPESFLELIEWVEADAERYERVMTSADGALAARGQRRLVLFDALDRLGKDWSTTRALTKGLLRRALAARSYRAIRLKLFMRSDQYADSLLFAFPDASKIKNDRVELEWPATDLYGLLFHHLGRSSHSGIAFNNLLASVDTSGANLRSQEAQKRVVDAFAGEFMGSSKKRGRVYTWLPLHLADAAGEVSPRTFLTAWREAANHGSLPAAQAVDHGGVTDGVRKASQDRLTELKEDYPWISIVLDPLRGHMVPMQQSELKEAWQAANVLAKVQQGDWLPPLGVSGQTELAESGLLTTLELIGVIEVRTNSKINVPDIYRVDAGIKRKGGVKPPRRGSGMG